MEIKDKSRRGQDPRGPGPRERPDRATVLHVQRTVLSAQRRPTDIKLEASGDSAAPVSIEAGIPRVCESFEVRCLLFDQGEQAQRRRPPPPRELHGKRHEVLRCWVHQGGIRLPLRLVARTRRAARHQG